MKEQQKIITELQSLLTQQIEDLHKELTPELVVRYGERDRRIHALFESIRERPEQG